MNLVSKCRAERVLSSHMLSDLTGNKKSNGPITSLMRPRPFTHPHTVATSLLEYVGYLRSGFEYFLKRFAYECVPTFLACVPSRTRQALSIPHLIEQFWAMFCWEKCELSIHLAYVHSQKILIRWFISINDWLKYFYR